MSGYAPNSLIDIRPRPQMMDGDFDAKMDAARKQADLALAAPELVEALRQIVSIEKRADDVRGSGMVDFSDIKAIRAMAEKARAALAAAGVTP